MVQNKTGMDRSLVIWTNMKGVSYLQELEEV